MVFASTSILVVEGGPQNGCHQHVCLQGESQLLPPSLEALQDQQVRLTQAFFKLLPQCWVLDHMTLACIL